MINLYSWLVSFNQWLTGLTPLMRIVFMVATSSIATFFILILISKLEEKWKRKNGKL